MRLIIKMHVANNYTKTVCDEFVKELIAVFEKNNLSNVDIVFKGSKLSTTYAQTMEYVFMVKISHEISIKELIAFFPYKWNHREGFVQVEKGKKIYSDYAIWEQKQIRQAFFKKKDIVAVGFYQLDTVVNED